MCYLVNKYSGDDAEKQKLYPTDPEQRAVIDRTLFFDIGTLYKSIVDYFVSLQPMISDSFAMSFMNEPLHSHHYYFLKYNVFHRFRQANFAYDCKVSTCNYIIFPERLTLNNAS
jgi:hypothetical protein